MKIAFDIDGVLACFEKNVYLVAQELFPDVMPENYIPNDWDYTDIFTKKQWNDVWNRIRTIPDFWLRQPDMPESIQALKEFRLVNKSPIWFITSRLDTGGASARYQTQLWLLQRGLISLKEMDKVIAVSKPTEKQKWIEDLGLDVSIDDLGTTVERHLLIPNHQAYLLDQPWNREYKIQSRVFSVKEFLEKIS